MALKLRINGRSLFTAKERLTFKRTVSYMPRTLDKITLFKNDIGSYRCWDFVIPVNVLSHLSHACNTVGCFVLEKYNIAHHFMIGR